MPLEFPTLDAFRISNFGCLQNFQVITSF